MLNHSALSHGIRMGQGVQEGYPLSASAAVLIPLAPFPPGIAGRWSF
jgi:hypothetical protein